MSIQLESIRKSYGELAVIHDVDLAIARGELFVLLGPSGSGKSTLLRIIAGLAEADAGRVVLDGRDVTREDPRRRNVGFVFQNYALFRHMSVAENVEFPLRVRRVPAAQRRARREQLLELVGLGGYGGRRPGQLSGGQQQRVALARALACEPRVLLLDEPFGALDAKIRVELRHTIRSIQRELGVTTVFVTHDQEEAFALADRLAVLDGGRLLEVGAPADLYLHPRHERVASFLGAANVLVGEAGEGAVRLGELEVPLGVACHVPPGGRVRVVFRPEDVELAAEAPAAPGLGRAVVEEATFAGSVERLRLRLPTPAGVRPVHPVVPFGSSFYLVDAQRSQPEARELPLAAGDEVSVGVRRVHVMAPAALRLLVMPGAGGDSPAAAMARELAERTGSSFIVAGSPSRGSGGGSSLAGAPPAEGFDLALCDLRPGSSDLPPELPGPEVDHLLLLGGPALLPRRLLVCVAVGEPSKAVAAFAERLAWRLGAAVTVLAVLPEDADETPPPHVERFLAAAERELGRRGVPVAALLRRGQPRREILTELAAGGHDLLVVGAPLPDPGEAPQLTGLVAKLLAGGLPCPLLVVRSYRPGAVADAGAAGAWRQSA
jgi:sulfate transport system ATP-binding protein